MEKENRYFKIIEIDEGKEKSILEFPEKFNKRIDKFLEEILRVEK